MPFVPMQVEVQILTLNPTIPASEIDDIKDRLRSYAERVNSGETTFNTLAVLYSEDASTATNGGELGFRSRSNLQALMPEYADVAFNLSEPGKVSRVFKTDNGYHIVQLIERRGDRINTRHIMLRPHVSDEALNSARERLDSIRADMLNNLFTFEEATALISQDKDTRNNRGVMVNSNTSSTLFEMGDLPQEVAKQVALMLPGQISQAFTMVDSKTNQEIVAIVKLTARHEAHRANVTDDYEVIQNMYENAERQRILNEWIDKKIAETYIRIEPAWRNCSSFRHNWLKESK
jgi:peptidyl-prolyl cis-trans isomerase SurA